MNKAHRTEAGAGRGIRMIRNTKTGRVGFRVQVMVKGKRAQRMVDSYEQAVALRDQWLKEGTPEAKAATPKTPEDAQTVEDAVRWYVQDLALRDRDAHGIYMIERKLAGSWPREAATREFLATPLAALDGHAIREFLHRRETESVNKRGRPFKRASILRDYRVFHAAIKKFRRDIEWPNFRGKRGWTEATKTHREPLTPEQKKRLLIALPEPYRTIAHLVMLTNPRRASFEKLEQSHLHLEGPTPYLLLVETKTRAEEIVPLEAEAVKLLRAQVARHPGNRWVFPSPYRKFTTPYHGTQLWESVKNAGRAIGRPDFTFHHLRHQYASDLLAAGYSPIQIAKAGRWARAVDLYMHQADADAREMQRTLAGHPARRGSRRTTSGIG